jgi:hypothetical protein
MTVLRNIFCVKYEEDITEYRKYKYGASSGDQEE